MVPSRRHRMIGPRCVEPNLDTVREIPGAVRETRHPLPKLYRPPLSKGACKSLAHFSIKNRGVAEVHLTHSLASSNRAMCTRGCHLSGAAAERPEPHHAHQGHWRTERRASGRPDPRDPCSKLLTTLRYNWGVPGVQLEGARADH